MNFLLISTISFFSSRARFSSRLVSREIKLERESSHVGERKFCKRGIKFDRGSKKEEKKKKKKKKERMVNNETRRWIA